MKTALQTVNQMAADGIVGQYAIGGAVGATFYLEPAATVDVDIFISLRNAPGSMFISLTPIYDYLTGRGCRVEKEYVIIGDWPVQFLPTTDALDEEAIAQAIETDVDGIRTRVMKAEHLVAIALRTGRSKDKTRIVQFIDGGALDAKQLDEILTRHGLLAKWEKFVQAYKPNNE
jgi:hypothetical protein